MLLSCGACDLNYEVAFQFGWLLGATKNRSPLKPCVVPPAGCCHSLVDYRERYLILFGGGSLDHFSNEVYVYDMDSGRWSHRTPENSDMVSPRLCHSSVIHKESMIVYGGQDLHSPVVYDDVLELDLVAWRWSVLQCTPAGPEYPSARSLHNAHVINGRMYVLMGTPAAPRDTPVLYLDLHTKVWHYLAPICSQDSATTAESALMPSLCGCSSALSGDSIYIFGGFQVEGADEGVPTHNRGYVNSLFEYNTVLNTWRAVTLHPLTPRPGVRYAASLAMHKGYAYVFGGDANQPSSILYYGDLWRIRVGDEVAMWQRVSVAGALRPSPRSGCAYTCARASLFVLGGEVPSEDSAVTWSYAADLFQLPLGFSSDLTLRDTSARWLGTAAWRRREACSSPWGSGEFPLPLGAKCALHKYHGD